MLLRIISGNCRGKKLKSPKNNLIRPTSDKVKEAVFNILGSRVLDSKFLDLFAGTGNIGIEALSRGAKNAVFVDNNYNSLKIIRQNLELANLLNRSEIINNNCLTAVSKLKHKYEKFNIIYMDPPYNMKNICELLLKIADNKLLDREGVLLVEHDKNKKLDEQINDLIKTKHKRYGDTYISYYTYDI